MPTIGRFAANMGAAATADGVRRVATLAEELGYDSLWMGEHVVAPSPRVPPSPQEPDYPILDPLVTLAYAGAVTERLRLATGIIILPQRNPLVLAKQLASLDVVTGGRVMFGVGVGYLEPEMTAIGVPMERRGARSDEYLAAMRSLWEDDAPEFHGEFVDFAGVDAYPRPLQRPLPVVVGGRTRVALRRAVKHGNGWYGWIVSVEDTRELVAALRAEAEAIGRDLSDFEITVSPNQRLTPEVVSAYGEAGADRLVIVPRQEIELDEFEERVRRYAPVASRA